MHYALCTKAQSLASIFVVAIWLSGPAGYPAIQLSGYPGYPAIQAIQLSSYPGPAGLIS